MDTLVPPEVKKSRVAESLMDVEENFSEIFPEQWNLCDLSFNSFKYDPSTLLQLRNCYILSQGELKLDDLWIRNGIIQDPHELFFTEKVAADVQLDCNKMIVSPGFIDLQINGAKGVDFSKLSTVSEDSVSKVSRSLLSHGVTSYCPTIVSSLPDVYSTISSIVEIGDGGEHGAGILGLHLEGPFISREKRGAHHPQAIIDFPFGISDVMNMYGEKGLKKAKIVTIAPELLHSDDVIRWLNEKYHINVSIGHSTCNLSQAESAFNSGATMITHLFNAMLPFHHRDPGIVGLLTSHQLNSHFPSGQPKKTYPFFGIIADNIHTHPAALRIAERTSDNGNGLILITDALAAQGLEPNLRHTIGDSDVEIRPNSQGGSYAAYIAGTNTLAGSIVTMDACVRNFQSETACKVSKALEAATLHPALAVGIENHKGTLNHGSDADLVVLDQNLFPQATFIAGKCVWKKKQLK